MTRAGPAEREVRLSLLRYATRIRCAVTSFCVVLGLALVPNKHWSWGLLGLVGWTWLYAWLLPRGFRWIAAADVLVLSAAAITQQWTVPDRASADSTGWVLAVLTVSVVTLQWVTPWWAGAVGTLVLGAAYVGGAWWAVGSAETGRLTMILWLVPQAALSRGSAAAVTRAARSADAIAAAREKERAAAAIDAARRADERERQALLHDTVAATLLMVGVGAIAGPSGTVREQAARDLEILRDTAAPVPVELGELLRREIARSPVTVRHDDLPTLRLPLAVATAVAGSVHEALANVGRHAGAGEARLDVSLDPLRITVSDRGRGFEVGAPAPHRYGIARSIVARMADAGGSAEVNSHPGLGTTVRLSWPDGIR